MQPLLYNLSVSHKVNVINEDGELCGVAVIQLQPEDPKQDAIKVLEDKLPSLTFDASEAAVPASTSSEAEGHSESSLPKSLVYFSLTDMCEDSSFAPKF